TRYHRKGGIRRRMQFGGERIPRRGRDQQRSRPSTGKHTGRVDLRRIAPEIHGSLLLEAPWSELARGAATRRKNPPQAHGTSPAHNVSANLARTYPAHIFARRRGPDIP